MSPVSTQSSAPVLVPRTARALIIMLVSLVLYTFADLASKEWALENLSRPRVGMSPPVCQPDGQGYVRMQRLADRSVPLIEGYLEFRYAENCGAAFGMLRTAPSWVRALVFGVAGIGACIVLTVMFMRGVGGKLFALSVPLVLSGAIGNLADRVRHGFVVDFIRFHINNSWEYPTFNVADITIAIGVGLLLLDGLKKPVAQPERVPSETSSPDHP
jgi:signal peptidase II